MVVLVPTFNAAPSQFAMLLASLPIAFQVVSLPSVVSCCVMVPAAMPPVRTLVIVMEGSVSTIVSVRLSGGGTGPKSLLETLSFHVPLRFGFGPELMEAIGAAEAAGAGAAMEVEVPARSKIYLRAIAPIGVMRSKSMVRTFASGESERVKFAVK